MRPSRDPSALIRRSARHLYAAKSANWPENDRWNTYKHEQTERFILRTGVSVLQTARRVLDAGAGDSAYDWMPSQCVSLDRHQFQLSDKKNAIVGDIERMPFTDEVFDLVICIGSVLNYVSAAEAMSELARVTASNGYLYLHFESSKSFEQLFSSSWGASARLNKTINGSRPDYIWIYSPAYVLSLLRSLQFTVLAHARFHIMSALCSRIGFPQRYAWRFAKLDRAAGFLAHFADDIVILARKT